MTKANIFHKSETRKFEDFGFMTAHLSFKPNLSEDRRRFGSLITIDDGTLAPDAKGFGLHPHQDVEVVTFMVEGEVNHHDPNESSHNGTLKAKGIQIITAGTGIVHNEINNSRTEPMRALQIWFEPRSKSLKPGYSKRQLETGDYLNRLQLVLSPDGAGGSLVVQQDVWLSYARFDRKCDLAFTPQDPENGVYVFMINGTTSIANDVLRKGDALGSVAPGELAISAEAGAEFLIFDLANVRLGR